jgi:hypothetical protein
MMRSQAAAIARAFTALRFAVNCAAAVTEAKTPVLAFLQGFVRFFVPTQTIWLTANEPQTLVKLTGQMGPPGSPELVISSSEGS